MVKKNYCKYAFKAYNIIYEENAVKTKDLIELLEKNGWTFKRHGADHDIYVKG